MAFQVRRVVTGHDEQGRAVVKVDEISPNQAPLRPGATRCNIWTTDTFPSINDGWDDEGKRQVGTTLQGGTVFRLIEFAPGVERRNHRTDSLDYVVVLSGEMDMELDETVVHLKAGDVLVQRGTIHNWVNNGSEPCVMAFVLVDAKSVEVAGKALPAIG